MTFRSNIEHFQTVILVNYILQTFNIVNNINNQTGLKLRLANNQIFNRWLQNMENCTKCTGLKFKTHTIKLKTK